MKDGLIIVQALLLAVCTAAIMLRKQTLVRTELAAWRLTPRLVRCHFMKKTNSTHLFNVSIVYEINIISTLPIKQRDKLDVLLTGCQASMVSIQDSLNFY